MPTLLVIDDEAAVRFSFAHVYGGGDVEVVEAATAADGIALFEERRPDVTVLDLRLPDGDGLDVFRRLREADPRRPVVFVTAHGTADVAMEAMKRGAFDYLVKPLDLDRLTQVLGRAFEAVRASAAAAADADAAPCGDAIHRIVGSSSAIQETCKLVGRVAPQDVTVLILGESGTGKELIARAVYQHSKRADGPFLAINCAAIPETLLESELFGHEKGAFTGADRRRVGKFEQCHSGTLFLDEIGDMPLALQGKMLRVLQDQSFERLGGTETVRTDVRLIAATNQDVEAAAAAGRFRADLYYRLRGATVRVPPLRDRGADIDELAHHFLARFNRELGTAYRGFDPAVLEVFRRHPWPGNVRELEATVREAMLRGAGSTVLAEFLSGSLQPADRMHPSGPPPPAAECPRTDLEALVDTLLGDGAGNVHARALAALERCLLPNALKLTDWNQTRASELLGISRGTLRQRLRDLGLSVERGLTEPGTDETD